MYSKAKIRSELEHIGDKCEEARWELLEVATFLGRWLREAKAAGIPTAEAARAAGIPTAVARRLLKQEPKLPQLG